MDYHFKPGHLPLVVSMPHAGTDIPDEIAARLTPAALQTPDTDWHLPELYGFLEELGASTLAARWSRYVIDLNRPPENTNLYPGQDTTGLCPVDTFGKEPLYLAGEEPSEAEIARRINRFWQPYHHQLSAEIARLVQVHGIAVVWDAHSIASMVPRFFTGKLPDLNFGTADGATCAPELCATVLDPATTRPDFTHILNGRFKGGYITRHYGQPEARVHAIQLEMCQSLYMNETAPFDYRPDLAQRVQPLLRQMAEAAARWANARSST